MCWKNIYYLYPLSSPPTPQFMIQLQRMPFHAIIKMFWSPSSAPEFQFQIGIDNQEEKKKKQKRKKKKKKDNQEGSMN
jgi:hypothetical protein